MKLSIFKNHLEKMESLTILNKEGYRIPAHFHLTEAGLSTKHFIDCGGTIRIEKNITLQLWVAQDTEHRLEPAKLLKILSNAEKLWEKEDLEIEFEYQLESINRFGVSFSEGAFILEPKQTNCLAQDQCGVKPAKQKLQLADLTILPAESCCTPGGGCC